MSWHYSTDMSRGGDPYDTVEPEISERDAEDYVDDYDEFATPDSDRWRWVAAVAGAVLLFAVVGTIVIVTGDDSATSARVVPSPSLRAAPPPPASTGPAANPATSLPPETVTTLTPSATAPSMTEAAPASPTVAAGPAVPPDSQAVIYTITGTKQAFDPVTVTYTDETGALRTDFDVSLPWSKKVVRSANGSVDSVTAVSFASHLNCTITDGNGQTLVSQEYNTIAATCNR